MRLLFKLCTPVLFTVYLVLVLGQNFSFSGTDYLLLTVLFLLIFGYTASGFYDHFIPKSTIGNRIIWLSLFSSGVLLLAGSEKYMLRVGPTVKPDSPVVVTALGTKNDHAKGFEVWLLDIKDSGKLVGFENIVADSSWEHKGAALLSNRQQPASLKINTTGLGSPVLSFLKHPWSGKISIKNGEDETIVDLYSSSNSNYEYKVNENQNWLPRINRFTAFISFLFFSLVFFMLFSLVVANKKHYYLVGVLLWVLLFVIQPYLTLTFAEAILLLFISIFSGLVLTRAVQDIAFKKIFNWKNIMILSGIALYGGFACIGSAVFLKEGTIDLHRICFYLLFTAWWFVIQIAFLYGTYTLKSIVNNRKAIGIVDQDRHKVFGIWILFFIIPLAVWIIYLAAFFPGLMSADSLVQWEQATGLSSLNNWHPVFHTLFNKLIISIYKSPVSIALAQLLYMSAVIASFLLYLYQKGVPLRWLLLFLSIFALLPNNGVLLVTLWKDIPFTTSLLWLTLVIAKTVTDSRYSLNWIAIPEIAVSLIAVALFRHNGILVYMMVVAFLLFYTYKKKQRFPVFGIFLSVVGIVLFFLLVLDRPGTIPNSPAVKLVTPIHGVAAVIKQGKPLPAYIQDKMEQILPKEEWEREYSSYSAMGYLFHTEGKFLNNLSKLPTGDALNMYAGSLFRYPGTVIKDRLQGSDVLWNVSRPVDAYNYHYPIKNDENVFGFQIRPSGLSDFLQSLLKWSEGIGEPLLWRAGLYNILIMLLIFLVVNLGGQKYLLIFLPWLGCIISLFIALADQDYRYVYFIFVLFGFLWLLTISKAITVKDVNSDEQGPVQTG